MTARNYSTVAVATTTTSSLNNSVTTIPVTALSGYPAAPFTGRLEGGTANEEIVTVTGVSGTNLTVLRGVDGSTPKAHASGVAFDHAFSARDFAEPNTHINANSGVHGVAGNVVGDTDAQTLANKTLTSPTINSPTMATIVNGGTLTLPTSTDTLVGRATTDTLTNKALTGATLDATSQIDGFSAAVIANFYSTIGIPVEGAWTTYSPSLTGGMSAGMTSISAAYMKLGKTLFIRFRGIYNGGSTNNLNVTLPASLVSNAIQTLAASASGATSPVASIASGATTVSFSCSNTTSADFNFTGAIEVQ